MAWYIVFFGTLFTAGIAAEGMLGERLNQFTMPPWMPGELVSSIAMLGTFLIAFGFLSRRFERQADVFAARTIEPQEARPTVVGPHGATVFASALHRVAVINNIPIKARSWCHGSIAKRMQYLRELAVDPARTARFDRVMTALYVGLLGTLIACAGWLTFPFFRGALRQFSGTFSS